MESSFSGFNAEGNAGSIKLQTVFDAERGSPSLIDAVARDVPQIRQVMASLRETLPLLSHSGIGPQGRFYRLPNHYRSVSFLLASNEDGGPHPVPGVIVFKGTEPLLPDFPDYLDWMLRVPFRSSTLPLGLHFPLDMRLPPAAMWIEECLMEQAVSSRLQQEYLERHGHWARLPVPLFVFKLAREQIDRYEDVVRSRIPVDAYKKIRSKLVDGLGVEVYFYPELPVRVADLFVGNTREVFREALIPEQVEETFERWAELMAQILSLGYMPYAPWHHGMGSCVDPGNACIDGGFNDLLTLIPFNAITDEVLFRKSLHASIQMLVESLTSLGAASIGLPSVIEPDARTLADNFLTVRLREHVQVAKRMGHAVDYRLQRFFDMPEAQGILEVLRQTHAGKNRLSQFVHNETVGAGTIVKVDLKFASGA